MVSSKKNYITREGYEKLVSELRELKEVRLPDILEKLAEAKAQGDLSENFEYKSAMEDKDFVNSKIVDLENLIANAEIISDDNIGSKGGEVDYGSTVTLSIEGDDTTYTVKIVGTGEVMINSKDNLLISLDSPMGLAIKGHKAGETVKMRLGNDRKNVQILTVK